MVPTKSYVPGLSKQRARTKDMKRLMPRVSALVSHYSGHLRLLSYPVLVFPTC